MDVYGVRLRPFTLDSSRSPMLYVLALEPFLRKLKANLVLCSLTLPGSPKVAWYTASADDVSMLVMSSIKVVVVSKEIGKYEVLTGVKIKVCQFVVRFVEGLCSSQPLQLEVQPVKDTRCLVQSRSPIGKN